MRRPIVDLNESDRRLFIEENERFKHTEDMTECGDWSNQMRIERERETEEGATSEKRKNKTTAKNKSHTSE